VEEEFVRDTEEEARRLVAVAVSDMPPGSDLLSSVRRRRAAHRVRIRAALAAGAAGAVAVAVAVAVVVAAAVTVGVPLARSALAAVTAAARLTAAQSYQMTVTSSNRTIPPWSAGMGQPWTVSGDFSPARGIGEEDGGQVRFVGGYVYTYVGGTAVARVHHGKSWVKTPEPSFISRVQAVRGVAAWLNNSVDLLLTGPQDLLGLLESATQVRETGTASGPGWTGTGYAFSAAIALGASKNSIMSISGTVGVDTRGRVRRLDATITVHVPPSAVQPPGVHITTIIRTVQVTLGDFGLPVSVTAPPASDVFTPVTRPIPGRR
jgi:hypothetical protein